MLLSLSKNNKNLLFLSERSLKILANKGSGATAESLDSKELAWDASA